MRNLEGFGEESIETRLESRVSKIQGEAFKVGNDLRQQGVSELGIAAYLSTLEYVTEVVSNSLNSAASTERGKFIMEFQAAIRTLAHGLLMGDAGERLDEQRNIALNPGRLRKEVSDALRRANGTGTRGPDETVLAKEHMV